MWIHGEIKLLMTRVTAFVAKEFAEIMIMLSAEGFMDLDLTLGTIHWILVIFIS